MADGTGPQIKRGRKYEQVIAGAREVFLRDGFEGASVDDIAKASGVSKATLYSYFPDKKILFAEVASLECERQAQSTIAEVDLTAEPKEALELIANAMVDFVTSNFGRNVFVISVAESGRFPELGEKFYESGPALVRSALKGFFECACSDGAFKIEDLDLAADQFLELCKAHLFPRILCGVQTEFSQAEKDRIAKGAVDMFLARYGA